MAKQILSKEDFERLYPNHKQSKKILTQEEFKQAYPQHFKTEDSFMDKLGQSTVNQLPALGMAGGSIVGGALGGPGGSVLGAGMGGYLGKAAQNAYNHFAHPEQAPKTAMGYVTEPIEEFGEGVKNDLVGLGLVHGASKVASPIINPVKNFIKNKYQSATNKIGEIADNYAKNATGATAKQLEKFKPGAGKELRERGLVQAFDTPKNIAKKANESLDKSHAEILSALESLDQKGAKGKIDNLKIALEERIKHLKKNHAESDIAAKLQNYIETVLEGKPDVALSELEHMKRTFQSKVISNWENEQVHRYYKELQRIYRKEVEREALQHSPELAQKFMNAKKDFGIVAPIEHAAQRRANQLNQHPIGGLLDAASFGAGLAHEASHEDGGLGVGSGLAAIAGRRILAPRSSSLASAAFGLAEKIMKASPEYSSALISAAEKGPAALGAMVRIIMKDPKMKDKVNSEE